MKCLDGPAMGREFLVRRCPIFLRVVEQGTLIPGEGEFDVLDLTSDEVSHGEVVHVYLRVAGTHSAAMIDGPKIRGHYEFADYRHVPTMPEEEHRLRDNDLWPGWCMDKARELAYDRRDTATEEGTMESQEPQGTEGELREEDVTRGDNLDDSVSEGDGLDDDQTQEAREALQRPGSNAEGEDSSSGEAPASSDPTDGQDAPESGESD